MPAFELYQPASVADALGVLERNGADAWVMAGGLDTYDWLKDRIRRPKVVVDLSRVTELRGIKEANGGLEIGAMTTLTEVANSALVKERYALLAEAAGLVASPQIRNQGTMGGNVSQDARCWYYRAGWPCYRAGGNICYADTPTSVNREHAIFDADRCVAVNPSDTAPALIALDAEMVVNRGGSELVVPAQDFFVGTGVDITRLTILQPGDLLTAVRIPGTWAGKQFYFEKVRDRQVWDFALVNIASAINASGNSISEARLVVNGVSARPFRLEAVEAFVRGKGRDEQTAEQAGELAVQGAVPLRHNAYKVPLMKNLVKRAIRGAGAWSS
jgi:xanthine dehydrogenase YagS FAD-binding subunit